MFFGKLTGQAIQWRVIDDTGDPTVLQVVFAQGEEQVYWQNGVNPAKAWDGSSSPIRELNTSTKMPRGTLMCYAHGRIVVGDDIGRIWVSDHFNGAGAGVRTNMDNFTETMTTGGGFYNAPASLGQLRSMIVAPYADNWFAQGSVVLGYDNGFATMDIRPQRTEWPGPRVSFTGAGAVGQRSIVCVNSEIWYRRHDGIGAYRQSRNDFEQGMDTPVSDEVRPVLDSDTPALRMFQPMAYFGNRLFYGVWPQREDVGGAWKVYCEKMVVADLARGSAASGLPGLTWEGLWSGFRPCGFATLTVDGAHRMLVFSADKDGKNRIYEVLETTSGRDYLENGTRQIRSWWTFASSMQDNSLFSRKRLMGGSRIILNHQGPFELRCDFKPENAPYWYPFMETAGVDSACQFSCSGFGYQSFMVTRSLKASAPDELKCRPFAKNPANTGFWFNIMFQAGGNISMVGTVFLADTLDDNTTCLDNDTQDYSGFYSCQQQVEPYLLYP